MAVHLTLTGPDGAGAEQAQLDLARIGGLGVTGAGADAAARALVAEALATPRARVVIPAEDAGMLALPPEARSAPTLAVAANPASAIRLTLAEVRRREAAVDRQPDHHLSPPVLLVTATAGRRADVMRQLARRGRRCNVAVLFLGHHPCGATVAVSGDGTIQAITPATGLTVVGATVPLATPAQVGDRLSPRRCRSTRAPDPGRPPIVYPGPVLPGRR